jgi:hypothetical protein
MGAHASRATAPNYLGWTVEEGSWFENPDEKGRIYTWKDNVLTPTNFRNSDAIPEATVRRFRNLKQPYMLARFGKSARSATPPASGQPSSSGEGTATGQVGHGPQPDPNMPYPISPTGLEVQWTYSSGDPATPQYLRVTGARGPSSATYFGWTPEEGSWFALSGEKGRIYTWKNNVLTQTNFRNYDEIPEATVRHMRNLQAPYLVAKFDKKPAGPASRPTEVAANPPPPARGDGLFGSPDAVKNALAGFQNQTAAPASGGITGTGATVQGGVLTFMLANNAKASYKVVRPAVMRNAPQGSGVTGTWIAMEGNGMGILFNVQPDGSVAGREMPAQIIQALTQAAAPR